MCNLARFVTVSNLLELMKKIQIKSLGHQNKLQSLLAQTWVAFCQEILSVPNFCSIVFFFFVIVFVRKQTFKSKTTYLVQINKKIKIKLCPKGTKTCTKMITSSSKTCYEYCGSQTQTNPNYSNLAGFGLVFSLFIFVKVELNQIILL